MYEPTAYTEVVRARAAELAAAAVTINHRRTHAELSRLDRLERAVRVARERLGFGGDTAWAG